MAWKKDEDKQEKVHAHRQKELALRAGFKDVKSVIPQGEIAKGSTIPSRGKIG